MGKTQGCMVLKIMIRNLDCIQIVMINNRGSYAREGHDLVYAAKYVQHFTFHR